MKIKHGFTLIELLLVVAIIASIFLFSAPYTIKFYQTNLLDDAQSNIIDTLQRARHYAVLQKNDSNFGVHFATSTGANSYTLFQTPDLTYTNRTQSQDEVFPLLSSIALSGPADIIFSKLTGVTGTTSTTSMVYSVISRGILTEESGNISKVETVAGG